MKVIIYKPTQNRKTQEIIQSIGNHSNSINIVFEVFNVFNLCSADFLFFDCVSYFSV